MPIAVGRVSDSQVFVDYEFTVIDKDKLAEWICQLLMGNCRHIRRVIEDLDPSFPELDAQFLKLLIDQLTLDIDSINTNHTNKIDGWLFQMMSWIALSIQHKSDNFHQQYPHSQPAMHGLDGLAITLDNDNHIKRIIVTEDKCTEHPRNLILSDVFPEFSKIENGHNNNALQQQIQALIAPIIGDDAFFAIQNDIRKKEYRQYRIGITREEKHNSIAGRTCLFKDYDNIIPGNDFERRTGASVYLPEMRLWMKDLRKKVQDILIAKIGGHV